jgi:hypothetical protein
VVYDQVSLKFFFSFVFFYFIYFFFRLRFWVAVRFKPTANNGNDEFLFNFFYFL